MTWQANTMTLRELLEALADAEARIAVMYERFATEFRGVSDVSDLWDSLRREEIHHAEVLTNAAAKVPDRPAGPEMLERLRALQERLVQYERSQQHVVSLQEALEFTADVEEAEAEYVHGALSSTTDTNGATLSALIQEPTLGHRLHHLLEHALELFGTPALRQRLAWRHFHL